jgi:hypothetical protein
MTMMVVVNEVLWKLYVTRDINANTVFCTIPSPKKETTPTGSTDQGCFKSP